MKYNRTVHHRHSIRLQGYDYSSAGAYFITICTQNRECFFGDIAGADMCVCPEMKLNATGEMVGKCWNELTSRFPGIELDEYVIMPNHFHGIIIVGATLVVARNKNNENRVGENGEMFGNDPDRAGTRPAPTKKTREISIGDIVGAFKSITSCKYIHGIEKDRWRSFHKKLWQRNYYEHIIRNEESWNNTRAYIINNPVKWDSDELNPINMNQTVGAGSEPAPTAA